MTIAAAAARCGLPESTLRYWERIGLVNRMQRGTLKPGRGRFPARWAAEVPGR
jgi:DNA-binding transcriptional MerR regulator